MNVYPNSCAALDATALQMDGICSGVPPSWLNPRRVFFPSTTRGAAASSRGDSAPPASRVSVSIYAVDDVPRLTELYARLLQDSGLTVRTFNDRVEALAVLAADRNRPRLLITDYLGLTMPVNQFLESCRLVHPGLRILMASGFCESEMRFTRVRPDCFIQKPFAPDEFERAVRAALAIG
jgi:CheY-like chemotaxis protein